MAAATPICPVRWQRAAMATEHLTLAERLVLALEAGESVGGDTKGETSANVMVFSEEEYPLCDIRVDEHEDPVAELRRLYGVYLDVAC